VTGAAPSHSERVDWLRLARTPQVGPVTFHKLIQRYGNAADAIDALPELARRGGRREPIKVTPREIAEQEIDATHAAGARLLVACEPEFPQLLAVLDPPPPVITTCGPLIPDDHACCAIVGSRNASAVGLRFARDIAAELGRSGIIVVSGLARGIDGSAHIGAIETGTVAVLAGGIDHVYPPEHAELHSEIAARGLLVTESRLGATPTARDFPRRNRLISGLALGTLVIEAALRSGSLITARFATEQGREIMATPGSPLDPRAKGSNRLIRDGAALVENADDVLDILRQAKRPATSEPVGEPWDPTETETDNVDGHERLLALLSPTPVPVDELVRQSGLPAGQVHALLMELELAGRAAVLPGGSVQLAWIDHQD
jgi:DNA processing protein